MSKKTITNAGIAKLVILSGVIICTSGILNAWRGDRYYVDENGDRHYHHRRGVVRRVLDVPGDVVVGTADVVTGDYPERHCRGRHDTNCYYYRRGRRYYRGDRPAAVRPCTDRHDRDCYRP